MKEIFIQINEREYHRIVETMLFTSDRIRFPIKKETKGTRATLKLKERKIH